MSSSYRATRLTFKRGTIEQLKPDESFSVETPEGVFSMTRQEFESEFSNVVASESYQLGGSYNYSKTPKQAYKYLTAHTNRNRTMPIFPSSHQSILDAAQTWAQSCLLADKSVFTDKSLWTPEILSEFADLFTDNPDWEKGLNFNQKLEKQLAEGATEVKQLAAELLWALFLFPTRFSAEKKEENIRRAS